MYKVSEITDLQDIVDLGEILQVDSNYPSSDDRLEPLSSGIELIDCLCQLQQETVEALADPNQLAGYVKGYWGTISNREMTEIEEAQWSHFLVRVADQAMSKLRLYKLSLDYMADGDGDVVMVPLRQEIGVFLRSLAEGEAKSHHVEDSLIVLCADVSADIKRTMEKEEHVSRFRRKDLPLPLELCD